MKEKTFLKRLNVYIAGNFKNKTAAAEHYGIFRQHLSQILGGFRPPTAAIMHDVGVKRRIKTTVVSYE